MSKMNIDTMEDKFKWQDEAGLITRYLGAAAGSRKIYVNIDTVPPGAFSTKYHSHSQQEEFFIILEGTGLLRLNNEEFSIAKGDFLSKPGAENIAHHFYNPGNDPLVILDIGTVEKEDTCYYPDEDIYLHKSNGERRVFSGLTLLKDWTSDPNK